MMNKQSPSSTSSLNFNLCVKRLSERAMLPVRGSTHAAGYDLYRYAHIYIIIATNVCI